MITKAGIVGPKNTVEMVLEISEEYKEKLRIFPFIYQNPEEAIEIVNKNQYMVDIWIFAGPVLQPIVEQSQSKQPFFFLQLDGASLTKTLVEIGYKDQQKLDNLSIDIIPKRDVYEIFMDLKLPQESIFSLEFSHDTTVNDLFTFHKDLYEQNKVTVCITCLFTVYEKLKSVHIPAYYISPTRTNIREILSSAIQFWETEYFKESQIAVIFIKSEKKEKDTDFSLSYEEHRLHLQLQSAIIDFSESISGSFVLSGSDFIIYSTRGSLTKSNDNVVNLLDKIALITNNSTNIGIGYGDTALVAEGNARNALQHAQNYSPFSAFIVDVEGTIEGPLRNKHSITFGYRLDKEHDLKLSGVTITTLNKLLSIQNQIKSHSITASDISRWLKMTPRNARRILNELVDQGYAEIIGEEAPTTKGRPRKIYHIKLPSTR